MAGHHERDQLQYIGIRLITNGKGVFEEPMERCLDENIRGCCGEFGAFFVCSNEPT